MGGGRGAAFSKCGVREKKPQYQSRDVATGQMSPSLLHTIPAFPAPAADVARAGIVDCPSARLRSLGDLLGIPFQQSTKEETYHCANAGTEEGSCRAFPVISVNVEGHTEISIRRASVCSRPKCCHTADSVLVSRIAWSCRAVNRSPPKRRPTRSAHRTFHMSSQRYHILIVYIILCN